MVQGQMIVWYVTTCDPVLVQYLYCRKRKREKKKMPYAPASGVACPRHEALHILSVFLYTVFKTSQTRDCLRKLVAH